MNVSAPTPAVATANWPTSRVEEDANDGSRARTFTLGHAVAMGLTLTLLQVAGVLAIAHFSGRLASEGLPAALCQWDGKLYLHVAEHGYLTTIPPTPHDVERSNVAFFPGYPLAGRAVSNVLGVSPKAGLVLAAQLAAWGFWIYWLLMLKRVGASTRAGLAATLVVACHPAAFFLVVAYSESFFMCAMLGFFYWLSRSDRRLWCVAALHGIVMTGTRLGGLPVVFCPLTVHGLSEVWSGLAAIGERRRFLSNKVPGIIKSNLPLAVVAIVASLGGLGFFAYCQVRFGVWNLYLQTQQLNWSVSADWLWWLRPTTYISWASTLYPNSLWPDDVSRLCVLITLPAIGWAAWSTIQGVRQQTHGSLGRATLCLAALVIFYLHAAGVSPIVMKSMIRYGLPVHVLLLLVACGGDWTRRVSLTRLQQRQRAFALAVGLMVLFSLQAALAWRFFSGEWAA